jgi:hypothetical protein
MPEIVDQTCPECPHELDEHTLDEESGLLVCDSCDCEIDPAEHGLTIEATTEDDEDDLLDDGEEEEEAEEEEDDEDAGDEQAEQN